MCYTEYFTSSLSLLREDIQRQIIQGRFNDTFVYDTDAWFPLMGYSFNPSTEFAYIMQKVLDDHGYRRDPIGMPIRALYRALKRSIDVTQLSDVDFELVSALKIISLHSNSEKWPAVTMDIQRPFIYTNGVKKNKNPQQCGYLDDTPMIRFGDSFTTGDGLSK